MKYNLTCKNCKLTFDSWFSSSAEYEKLRKKKLLSCHNCNSLNVEKSLMAPKLINKNLNSKYNKRIKNLKTIKKTFEDYQKFIKKNVGLSFKIDVI